MILVNIFVSCQSQYKLERGDKKNHRSCLQPGPLLPAEAERGKEQMPPWVQQRQDNWQLLLLMMDFCKQKLFSFTKHIALTFFFSELPAQPSSLSYFTLPSLVATTKDPSQQRFKADWFSDPTDPVSEAYKEPQKTSFDRALACWLSAPRSSPLCMNWRTALRKKHRTDRHLDRCICPYAFKMIKFSAWVAQPQLSFEKQNNKTENLVEKDSLKKKTYSRKAFILHLVQSRLWHAEHQLLIQSNNV